MSIAPWLLLALSVLISPHALALGQPRYVEITPDAYSFRLVHQGAAAKLYVDGGDYPGVVRAAHDLQADIFRVSGCKALLNEDGKSLSGDVVLIGTIGKSKIIDRLIREEDRCKPDRGQVGIDADSGGLASLAGRGSRPGDRGQR